MEIVSSVADLKAAIRNARHAGRRIGFVPTMGNLHEGHLQLVKCAGESADFVVASIFVNPLQFGPDEDYSSYPRTPETDKNQLLKSGTDLLFLPSEEDIYPGGKAGTTMVSVPALAGKLCGASRPGHFDGVATVVARLFNLVTPQLALFGEKDFQQLQVIRRMVQELAFDIEVVGLPTVRELDGLAMSSRNRYLDAEQRAIAPLLYQSLNDVAGAVARGNPDFRGLEDQARHRLGGAGFEPEYFTICRQQDLEPAQLLEEGIRVFAAARLGKARLIDNLGMSEG